MKMDVGLEVALSLLLVLLAQRADLGTVIPLPTLEEVSTWPEEFTTSSSDAESSEGGVRVLPGKGSFNIDRVTPSHEPREEHGNFIAVTKSLANPQLGASSEAELKTGWVSASTIVVTKADIGNEPVIIVDASKPPANPQLGASSKAEPKTVWVSASTTVVVTKTDFGTEHVTLAAPTKPPANRQLGASSKAEPKTGWVSTSTTLVTKADFGTEQVTSEAATKPPANLQPEVSSKANPSTRLALASTANSTGTEAVNTTGGPGHLSAEKSASPAITTPPHAPDDANVLLTSLPSATINPFRQLTSVVKSSSAATATPSGSSSTREDTVTNASTWGSGDETVTSAGMSGNPGKHWYIVIAVVLLALLVLVACFVVSIQRRKNSGSTSFQNPSKKKKKKGGEDAWAGPVQMPDENGMLVDVVDDDKDPSGKRLTLTTFFGKRKSRQCSVLLEEVTVPSEKPAIEDTDPLLSQGANGQVYAGAVPAPGNKDSPPTAREPKPTSTEKEASPPPTYNGQNSAMQAPPQANTVDPGDLPPPPSPPLQTDLPPPPPEANEPSSAI